jgi:hypothetical protein
VRWARVAGRDVRPCASAGDHGAFRSQGNEPEALEDGARWERDSYCAAARASFGCALCAMTGDGYETSARRPEDS